MTKILSVFIVLLIILFAPAAPHDGTVSAPPLHFNEALSYAEQLTQVVHVVALNYIRPVPRTRLYSTALAALYEQAGKPLPASLDTDLARALHELPGDGEEAEPAPRPTTPGDQPIIELIARHRQELGDLEALRGSGALRLSIEALLQSLDPFCGLVSNEDVRRGRGENLNCGFGFTWSADSTAEELLVTAVPIGGPAQRAGIRPGDRLTNLRYQPARLARQPQPAIALPGLLLLAQPGDPLQCTVARTGATVTLHHEYFQVQAVLGIRRQDDDSWCYWLDPADKIGYARLGSLDFGAADQLRTVIHRLKQDGMRGLVLDLRWCPGGFLSEAVLIANLFMAEGQIALVRCRNRPEDEIHQARSHWAFFPDLPLVILTNGDTSGGAELIAAALQDHDKAVVVGQRSRGKASVQGTFEIPIGIKLTTGQFFRPNGQPLQRPTDGRPAAPWGVRPQPPHELPITPDLSDKLRDEWTLLALRPGNSKDVLFLDDPENDPQQQAALVVMRERLAEGPRQGD